MDKSEWQTSAGDTWAAEWRRTDRSFIAVTDKLIERTRSFNFSQLLDIGCGAGELSLALGRGRPEVRVLGVDVSPALVTAARSRAVNLANVDFDLHDAATWAPPAGFAPQLLVSRHGVMFFDDPPAAFANLARAADAGANLLFSCFRSPAENPFFTDVARLLPQAPPPPPPGTPGPFAFADKDRMTSILTAGGWESIAIDPFDFAMVTGAGPDPVEDAVGYFSTIGPAATAARAMEESDRERFLDRIRDLASRNCREGIVSLPAAGWIVTARRA
ncbi:methyltransferase domain-containing protein [Alteraurantiacibacter aestuarii]|nr:class I SAM-dependent methyltransferase [Alteraurantiacibacter aestuarii]